MVEPLEREIEGLRALFRSDRDPEGRAFVPLADAYRRNHDLQSALDLLHEGLEHHPMLASAYVVAAWTHRDRGDPATARAAFRRVLELDEENVEALRGLATLLLESGRVDEARPYLEKVRSLNPDDPDVRGQLESLGAQPRAHAAPDSVAAAAVEPSEPEREPAAGSATYDEIAIERIVALAEAATVGGGADSLSPPLEAERSGASEEAGSVAASQPEETQVLQILESLADSAATATEEVLAPEEPARAARSDDSPVVDGAPAAEPPARAPVPSDEPLVIAAGAQALIGDGEIVEVWSDRAAEDEELEAVELPATRTLAELFARQGLFERAAEIYERLAVENPGDAGIEERLEVLRVLLRPYVPAAPTPSVHADDTEAIAAHMSGGAHPETAASPFWTPDDEVVEELKQRSDPVSGYFRRLLEWTATAEQTSGPVAGGGVYGVAEADDAATATEPQAVAPDEQAFEGELATAAPAASGTDVPADAGAGLAAEAAVAPDAAEVPYVVDQPEAELPPETVSDADLALGAPPAEREGSPSTEAAPERPDDFEASQLLSTEEAFTLEPPSAGFEVRAATDAFEPESDEVTEADVAAVPAAGALIDEAPPGVFVPIEPLSPNGVVSIEALAPDHVVPIESLAPSQVVPITSLAPDAVPIESLAPDAEPSHDGSTILF